MNSLGNDPLERRMEELLSASVERGSEPAGFSVGISPLKPSFPWMKLAAVLVAAVIAGFFLLHWLEGMDIQSSREEFFSLDALGGFFHGISSGRAVSLVAVLIGIVGSALVFLPDGNRVLRRML